MASIFSALLGQVVQDSRYTLTVQAACYPLWDTGYRTVTDVRHFNYPPAENEGIKCLGHCRG